MKVGSYELTPEQEQAGLAVMCAPYWKIWNVELALRAVDVPEFWVFADRLLKRERKAGRIAYSGGYWRKVVAS